MRTGQVTALGVGRAMVTTFPQGFCEGCRHHGECGEPGPPPGEQVIEVRNPIGAGLGDLVEFSLPEGRQTILALLVWSVPLVGLVAGVALPQQFLGVADARAALGGVAGLAVGFVPALLVELANRRRGHLLPVICRIVTRSTAGCLR